MRGKRKFSLLHRVALKQPVFQTGLHWNYTELSKATMAYPIVRVSRDAAQLEQLGSKPKFWTARDRLLFKASRPGTGEDWAEKVSAELAAALEMPHAQYNLATCGDVRGVITPSFVPKGARLIHGNELIFPVVAASETEKKHNRLHFHTALRIHSLLNQKVSPPFGWHAPDDVSTTPGVFSGYLLLDALIGNQDRHEENWGLILHDQRLHLAPTFDHASSLGRNESDETRERILRKNDGVAMYTYRAKSLIYNSKQHRLSTYDAFQEFLSRTVNASSYWLNRLDALTEHDFERLLLDVPDEFITARAREFACSMLIVNRERLLREE